MDPAALAAAAVGDSVTADRLTEPILDALDGDQPHHLVRGSSLDIERGGETDRVFSTMDGHAAAVTTPEAVVFIVDQSLGSRTEEMPYVAIDDVRADGTIPKTLTVESGGHTYRLNVDDDERPGPVAAFVTDGAAGELSLETADGTAASAAGDGGTAAGSGAEAEAGRESEGDTTDPTDSSGPDGGGDSKGAAGSDNPADGLEPLEALERLADLNDRGVVDDAEFEEKKRELLEEI